MIIHRESSQISQQHLSNQSIFEYNNNQAKMFSDFENMIKDKINSLKETPSTDITRVPQRYNIKGKHVQQLKLLSEGSFGFIWLAEDVNTKQKFALKRIVCMTNERLRLAKNELDLMSTFPKSKNLVTCYGGDLVVLRNGSAENKVLIILMEYCPHGTLFDLLESRENKGFNQKELLTITQSILQGLKSIHQTGCYHQDVKIENVLIGEDHSYKLCDFGSCSNRIINFAFINKAEYNSIKEEIESVTTPMYRPPEIVDPYKQYEVSFKVDVWMVGCVLYTLAFFTHPFVDSNAIGIADGVYRFPKYPEQTPYQVSDRIKDLIRNFLTPNPAYRVSVQQALHLVNNWYTLSEIPLNKEAKRRKEEEKIKQKEMERLNRKVVDFDGDIPEDRLLELQRRLKNKDTVEEVKATSFITSKDTKLIKEGKTVHQLPNYGVAPQPKPVQSNQQVPATQQQAQQSKPSFDMNSFWNAGTTQQSNNKPAEKFDAFSNFFPTNSEPAAKKQPVANSTADMYDYFFTGQSTKVQSAASKPPKTNQVNLLDL